MFSASRVTIGRDTLLAAYCYVIGGDHDFSDPSAPVLAQGRRSSGVTIGAGAWLGAGAKILDGVTIGDRAIVGAGAVVREAVPEGAIAVGMPARVVRAASGERPPSPLAASASRRAGSRRRLNVLQVCDHLGWEGSRMHGVKRLFSWMIPRFDPERYNVSLVSLRKKDLSEETLESMGIDISYLHKSKFDPATLTALLKVIDRQKTDILHLHGYGATTFGRLAGTDARAADDPARARQPDRHAVVPEGRRPDAGAGDRHRDRGVEEHRRLRDQRAADAARAGQGGLPRRAAGGVQPHPHRRGDCARRATSSAWRPASS